MKINGQEYEVINPYNRIDPEQWDDAFAMVNCLQVGECMGYFNGTYVYRDKSGDLWQCYKDNTENCWLI